MKRCLQSALVLLILLPTVSLSAQDDEPQLQEFARPSVSGAALEQGFAAMYDLKFEDADLVFHRFIAGNPRDPLGPAALGASMLFALFEQHDILQSEFFSSEEGYGARKQVVIDESARKRFNDALNTAEELARITLVQDPSNEHALFALTLVYGLRADCAALIEHRDFWALRFSDTSNGWARKLLEVSPDFCDAYVATGVQKYLVGLKPAPVRWMLQLGGIKGDQRKGIEELQLAAEKGRYLSPFARILLAVAHLRVQDHDQAFSLLSGLQRDFPHNHLFAEEMAKLRPPNNPQVSR